LKIGKNEGCFTSVKILLCCVSTLCVLKIKKQKKMNGVYQDAPLKVRKSVQNPKSREI